MARCIVVCAGLFLFSSVKGQTYKFHHFRTDDGLPQPFSYTIQQDDNGYLWIGTGDGLARFDGFGFEVFNTDNGLAHNVVTRSFKDSKGRIWFGHDQGSVSVLTSDGLTSLDISEHLTTSVTGIVESPNGAIWIASQSSGLVRIGRELNVASVSIGSDQYLIKDINWLEDQLIIATDQGLFSSGSTDGSTITLESIKGLENKSVSSLALDENDLLWIATVSDGIYTYAKHKDLVKYIKPSKEGPPPNIQKIIFDRNGELWIATFGSGLIKCKLNAESQVRECIHFNSSNGTEHDHIKDVFQDREGNIWIAKFGDGIATLMNNAIVFYMDRGDDAQNVLAMEIMGDRQYVGTENGLLGIDRNASVNEQIIQERLGLPDDAVTAIHTSPDGTTWIGTRNSGLYKKTTKGSFEDFQLEDDRLSKMITHITSAGEQIWVATKNGVYGISNGNINDHLNTSSGLSHNAVNHVFIDKKDRLWVATNNNGLCVLDDENILQVNVGGEGEIFNVMAITQDSDEDIWVATYGNGIYRLSKGTVRRYSVNDGLHSSFCYSILADNAGKVWVGHHGGISSILENNSIKVYDKHQGVSNDMNPNALVLDDNGNIWFGTNNGMVRYDPEKDKKNLVAPLVNITAVKVFDEEMDLSTSIDLAPDIYKIRFEFLGLSLKNSEDVTYQYKLEGHDLEWSEPSTSNFVTYRRVGPGEFNFLLRACNSDGICSEKSISLPLVVQAPIWQRWWFIAISGVVVILLIRQIIRSREKRQRKVQEYLQNSLEERTVEVRAKSAEIEQKNKDITDSLNYAKHIQQAILPEDGKLKELFPDSFIFHQPRDIVSGDFYWFKRFGQKFVIACADATGHGVPGAFMSMIGSILLRDISTMREIDSPEKLLDHLDKEVRSLLKQRKDGVTSNDGMDITICEIDLESRKIRTASAMHSIFINRNGSLERIKGDRHSIGGVKLNGTPLRFSLQEHDLEPGDKIYLFSDGLQDQFGGMDGKKMKIRGTVELLESIMHRPMEEQSDLLKKKFKSWMNGFEQVDDVLFIGLQV